MRKAECLDLKYVDLSNHEMLDSVMHCSDAELPYAGRTIQPFAGL